MSQNYKCYGIQNGVTRYQTVGMGAFYGIQNEVTRYQTVQILFETEHDTVGNGKSSNKKSNLIVIIKKYIYLYIWIQLWGNEN